MNIYIIFSMIVILSTLLTNIIIGLCQSINTGTQFVPIEALSISIDNVFLNTNIRNNQISVFRNLSTIEKKLQACQVIGSISQINLKGSSQLQFYFKYKLEKKNSTLIVDIFAKNDDLQPFSQDLLIVLDFLIATFPLDYSIMEFKMTSYQEHISYHTDNSYQLIFFLNGFKDAAMSGNVTHSYQQVADLYTIHYMSCETQSNQMGWQETDYLYFTVLVVPMKNLVQKFKINDTIYKVDFKDKTKYFYGIKGSTDPQFVGSFHERYGGVNFNADSLAENKTYGVIYLPYPDINFLDNRLHASTSIIRLAALISCATLLLIILVGVAIKKKCGYKISKILTTDRELNEEQQSKQTTKSQLRADPHTKLTRQQRRMSTVPQVEEGLEGSLKGSYNPKVDKMPSLVLND